MNNSFAQQPEERADVSATPPNKKTKGKRRKTRLSGSPEHEKIDVPLDIALSLFRPDELEKLKNYVTSYLAKYGEEAPER